MKCTFRNKTEKKNPIREGTNSNDKKNGMISNGTELQKNSENFT